MIQVPGEVLVRRETLVQEGTRERRENVGIMDNPVL